MNNETENIRGKIEDINFGEAISQRYLSYALSTIMSRSLPDVRDGLKPVHRRLLYAMLKLNLDPSSGYKKCARVVGDVIGKYHPHGDVAVYESLARLAQSFSLRYPLIDGQGNFGSIDGDNPAAMRYTESRLTEIASFLIKDIDQDTVDFIPTYDDSDHEPILLPSSFPNLLANGCEGIAVGMATSIPPHNLDELCSALLFLIENRETAKVSDITNFILGPDFPTGGVITDKKHIIQQAYATGKGGFKIRAKWHKEEFSHGLYQIVVTEIPYQVQKSKLIEQIANLLKLKKIPLVANIRDESTEEVRVVIEPKGRSCDPVMIMESLFKLSELETRFHLNMNVLSSNSGPRVMNILEVLEEFIQHREKIVTRRTSFELRKTKERLEILIALRIAYLNLDEVIRIVREEDDPKNVMIAQFKITEFQAEAILNIKLRALRKLEEAKINEEFAMLQNKAQELQSILDDPSKLKFLIKKEIEFIQNKFGKNTPMGARRTIFEEVEDNIQELNILAFVEKEPITIVASNMAWIKALKGHNLDLTSIKYKEGDSYKLSIEAYTTDNIIIFSSAGKFFTILGDNIFKGKGQGESIRFMVDFGNADIVSMFLYQADQSFLLASSAGRGFLIKSDDLIAQTRSGKQIMQLAENVESIACIKVEGDMVACIGSNRKLLTFKLEEVPYMKKGQGVTLQKYKNASLSDIKTFQSTAGLSWTLGSKTRTEDKIFSWHTKRGGIGKIPPVGFPKNNKF